MIAPNSDDHKQGSQWKTETTSDRNPPITKYDIFPKRSAKMTIPSSNKILGERPSPLVRVVHNFFTAGLDSGQPSLVPRRSLLPRCPREVWERAGVYLSVTSQLTVESRIDRAENA